MFQYPYLALPILNNLHGHSKFNATQILDALSRSRRDLSDFGTKRNEAAELKIGSLWLVSQEKFGASPPIFRNL